MLEIDRLSFAYQASALAVSADGSNVPLLDQLSLTVRVGELVVVLGPNGAGKSTLLKLIAGVLPLRHGRIRVDATDLAELSARDRARRVAYLPQLGTTSEVTVFEAVLLGRLPHLGISPGEQDLMAVDEMICALGLAPLSQRRVTRLSGGELQKVLIARALVQSPRLLLLDEPVNHLDLRNQMAVLRSIRVQVRQRGLASLVVLHDINLALRFADRFLLLAEDATVAQGAIDALAPEAVSDAYGIEVTKGELDGVTVMIPTAG